MTLDEVRAGSSPGSFPSLVFPADTAFDFFGAWFLGRNSAIHLLDGGVRQVFVIDREDKRLAEMAAIYPKDWRFVAGDCYELASLFAEHGRKADLVVVDPWTQDVPRALSLLHVFARLSRRWLVFGLTAAQGDPPDLEAILERVDAPLEPHGLLKRSEHAGGVWWGVAGVV